ncbi:MAG: hypothetical protein WAW63_00195 [Candidatus Saccharimonadales bacterium]|jgi:hypothetical protein|nr:hypothetical protein [Candidatus Saccharibacteria bacterium]
MSAKGFGTGIAVVGLAVGAGIVFAKGYDFGCAGNKIVNERSLDIASCAGKTVAKGMLSPIEKLDETASSTVPVTVIGEVVMRLNGTAVVDINNQGFSKVWDGNIFAKTDSTLFWNRKNDKPVTVIYNPCFGMTVNGLSEEKSLAEKDSGYNSAPVSTVVADVTPVSPTEVSIKIKPGPMQICSLRVSNADGEPGGKANQELITNDNGGIIKTNMNTGAMDAVEAAVVADINRVVKESAAMQACPEEALNRAGLSQDDIKAVIAQATIGGLLKQYANDKPMTMMISNAFNDYVSNRRPGSVIVELGSPQDRMAMYQKKLEATVGELTGKVVELPEHNVTYSWQQIQTPKLVSCGTGTLRAPN